MNYKSSEDLLQDLCTKVIKATKIEEIGKIDLVAKIRELDESNLTPSMRNALNILSLHMGLHTITPVSYSEIASSMRLRDAKKARSIAENAVRRLCRVETWKDFKKGPRLSRETRATLQVPRELFKMIDVAHIRMSTLAPQIYLDLAAETIAEGNALEGKERQICRLALLEALRSC